MADDDFSAWGDLFDPNNPVVSAMRWVTAAQDMDQDTFVRLSAQPAFVSLPSTHAELLGGRLQPEVIQSADPARLVGLPITWVGAEDIRRPVIVCLVRFPEAWLVLGVSHRLPTIEEVFEV